MSVVRFKSFDQVGVAFQDALDQLCAARAHYLLRMNRQCREDFDDALKAVMVLDGLLRDEPAMSPYDENERRADARGERF